MNESKVEAIRNCPTHKIVKDLQRFLRFANFYCRFIHNYSSITLPLMSLISGNPKSLSWPQETAFNTLKEVFCDAQFMLQLLK